MPAEPTGAMDTVGFPVAPLPFSTKIPGPAAMAREAKVPGAVRATKPGGAAVAPMRPSCHISIQAPQVGLAEANGLSVRRWKRFWSVAPSLTTSCAPRAPPKPLRWIRCSLNAPVGESRLAADPRSRW